MGNIENGADAEVTNTDDKDVAKWCNDKCETFVADFNDPKY